MVIVNNENATHDKNLNFPERIGRLWAELIFKGYFVLLLFKQVSKKGSVNQFAFLD